MDSEKEASWKAQEKADKALSLFGMKQIEI